MKINALAETQARFSHPRLSGASALPVFSMLSRHPEALLPTASLFKCRLAVCIDAIVEAARAPKNNPGPTTPTQKTAPFESGPLPAWVQNLSPKNRHDFSRHAMRPAPRD